MLTCDRCGAQALWAFLGDAGTLLLCGHHASIHSPALRAAGFSQGIITAEIRPDALARA